MAVNIPTGAKRQARDQHTLDNSGKRGFVVQYKGADYDALKTALAAMVRGDTVESGWVLDSATLEGVPGAGGLLTLNCIPEDTSTSGGESSQTALKAVWSCHVARNDMSILAYCGKGQTNPNRVWIELWMKETNYDIARQGGYTRPDGTVADLAGETFAAATSELMVKIEDGVESVMRFYPILTCKSYWSRIPRTFLQHVMEINTPAAPDAHETHAPTNLSSVISGHSWLKVQDDVDENPDGGFVRVESWWGLKNGERSWDPNLYGVGQDRWKMPHEK